MLLLLILGSGYARRGSSSLVREGNLTGIQPPCRAWVKAVWTSLEIVPKAASVGVLINPSDTSNGQLKWTRRAAARSIGQLIEILRASTERDNRRGFLLALSIRGSTASVHTRCVNFGTQAAATCSRPRRRGDRIEGVLLRCVIRKWHTASKSLRC